MKPVCESVKQWAQANGSPDVRVVLPARRFSRALPRTLEPHVDEVFLSRLEVNQKEKYLALVRGARLLSERGTVMLPDGSYAAESLFGTALLESDEDYVRPPEKRIV